MSATRANSASRRPRTSAAPATSNHTRSRRLPLVGLLLILVAAPAVTAGNAYAMGLPRSAAGGRLTVRYDDGAGHTRTYRLDCGRASLEEKGESSDACRRLAETGGPVPALASGQVCSMIYGGPQTAEVSGMWNGEPVRETYRRTNGCEVSRWSHMVPALPKPNQA
ncbi:MAG: hypothetical protein QOF98_2968 [Streptomyces sp.]|nr:hypothetical protein [Streptomyces sp.]